MDVRQRVAASTIAVALAAAGASVVTPTLKQDEGLALTAYIDPVGVRTWCYGDTGPVPKHELTVEFCDAQLERRIAEHCVPVLEAIHVPLNRNQAGAICSWSYNVGISGAKNSTVVRKLNEYDYSGASEAFLMWYKAGGKDCRIRSNNCYGLWKRRLGEKELFDTPVYVEPSKWYNVSWSGWFSLSR